MNNSSIGLYVAGGASLCVTACGSPGDALIFLTCNPYPCSGSSTAPSSGYLNVSGGSNVDANGWGVGNIPNCVYNSLNFDCILFWFDKAAPTLPGTP